MKYKFRRIFAILLILILPTYLLACSNTEDTRPTEGTGTVTLSAVGDIYLSDEMLLDAKTASGDYDFRSMFADIFPVISSADIAIGNFEGTFAASGNGSYPDALAETLAAAGFDILQTANSYSVYNGLSGLERTKAVIEENGMTALGTYTTESERTSEQVILREINGIRFAFVAFTKGFSGMGLPAGSEHCVNLLYTDYTTDYEDVNTSGILSVLEQAKKFDPDFIIAALHWGSENVSGASETQDEITDLMFRNGVDVILGSHSHRIGEVETKQVTTEDREEKNCIVAYSLGDFCTTESGKCNTSIVLHLEFTRDHASGKSEISNVSYTPVSTIDNEDLYDTQFAVVPTDDAIRLYEGNYYLRVSENAYKAMVDDREDLDKAVFPTEAS